jgi:hypothetical protein
VSCPVCAGGWRRPSPCNRCASERVEFHVHEYYPPPRVEAWLTLPPGVVVRRDLIAAGEMDEPCEEFDRRWMGSTPPENRATTRRFIAEFGEEAAYRWKFPGVPGVLGRVMRDVFSDARSDLARSIERQFYMGSPFQGKTATIPLAKKSSSSA